VQTLVGTQQMNKQDLIQSQCEMAKDNIVVTIEIGNNDTQESVWTTDLSYEYIKINAEYRT
jgi:glutamate N-acetyltransferase/amino-acid N-acetyltransferase